MQMSVPEIPYNTIATKSIISKVVKIPTLELNQKKKSVCYLCTKHQQIVSKHIPLAIMWHSPLEDPPVKGCLGQETPRLLSEFPPSF